MASPFGVQVLIKDQDVRGAMQELKKRGGRPPLKRLMVLGQRSVLRNFAEQGRPEKWKSIERDGMILQDTGRLKQSIDTQIIGTKDNFKVYTQLPYAAVHNYGFAKRNIAARPYMLWQADDIKMILKVLSDHMAGI